MAFVGRGKKVQMKFETEIKLRGTQKDRRDKKMTTGDNILKIIIFLSLVVIICHGCLSVSLSILFLSQISFVLSCPVFLSDRRDRAIEIGTGVIGVTVSWARN
jgi:hypothetical protein